MTVETNNAIAIATHSAGLKSRSSFFNQWYYLFGVLKCRAIL